MRLFRQQPTRTLSEWLDLATRDLVPSAQARIRTEIEAHYNEAVQARLVIGWSESNAKAGALLDLGSANTAGRRFRKKYLTRFEVYRLRETINGSLAWACAAVTLYCLLPFGVFIHSLRAEFLSSCLVLAAFGGPVIVLFATRLAIYFLIKRSADARTLGQVLLFRIINPTVYATTMLVAGWHLRSNILHAKIGSIGEDDSFQLAAALIVIIYCACIGLSRFRLRQKLLSTDGNWNARDYLATWP
jgi:hypothetical protein